GGRSEGRLRPALRHLPRGGGDGGGGERPPRRYGAVVPGLRQLRHVQGLRRSGRTVRPGRGGAGMNPTASLRPWVQLPSRINGGFDTRLLAVTCALVSIGLVMVSSASISYAEHLYGDGFYFFKRHLIYLAMAAIAGAVVLQVPVRLWYRYSDLLMVMAVLLLVAVLIPGIGREVNGARRWIGLGIINLQIAEVAKLAMIVFLAAYLQRHQLEVRASWLGFLRPTGMLGIVALLLLLQPDFGSAVVICGTALGLLFLGGVQLWIFGALLGLGGTLLALLAITSPYRMQRLVTFLDPWADRDR